MSETKTFTMEALRQITNLTRLDDSKARKLLNKHNGNADAAIDAYYNSQRDTYLENDTNNDYYFNESNSDSDLRDTIAASLVYSPPPPKNQYYINRYKKQMKLPLNKRPSSEHKNNTPRNANGIAKTGWEKGVFESKVAGYNQNVQAREIARLQRAIAAEQRLQAIQRMNNTRMEESNNNDALQAALAMSLGKQTGSGRNTKKNNKWWKKKRNNANMGGSRRKRRKSRRKIAGTYSQLAKNLLNKKRIVDVSPLGHPSLVGKNLGKVSLSRGKESPFVPKKVYSAPSVGLVNWNPRAVPGKTHKGGKRRKSRKRRKTRRRRTTRKGK